MTDLSLPEELLLLALDDESGKLRRLPDRALDYAIAGSLLAALVRCGAASLNEKQIKLNEEVSIIESHLKEAMKEIKETKQDSLRSVISYLAREGNEFRQNIIDSLLEKEVLREEDDEILWVFHRSRYPLEEEGTEEAIKDRVRQKILGKESDISESDHVLISLIHACQLGRIIFPDGELEDHAEKIETIASHDLIGSEVINAIFEIQRALLEIRTYSGM